MTKSALKKLKVFVLAAFLVLFVAGTVYAVIQPRPITAYATDYYLNDVRLANSASNGHWYTYYSNDSRAYVTGVYQNNNGWWYVENGEVNFNYTGFADNSNGRWRIENGKVNFNYKDIVYESSQWRYYYNGMFQKSYTGVTNCCNSYGWWYVKNGVVDFSYNGVADNNNGTWKIEGGKVNFGFNGTQIINGEQYNFVGGKVSFEEYEATTYTVGEIPYTQEVLSTSVNGQEIYVREYIPEQLSGETVIVSHGLDGNCEDMVFYAEALAKNGHIAFIFDYRGGTWDGTCKSDGNYDDMSVDTELLDLDAVYELATAQENVNTSNITLLGHSQGGFVSALYAGNNNNKIKNLVLVAPAYCIPDWGRANRLLPAWYSMMQHCARIRRRNVKWVM